MKEFFKKYKHAWCLLYIFIYLPWFAYLEQHVVQYRIVHIRLDDYIPFIEYFIVPYLLWFVYVAGAFAFFLFFSKEDYYKLCVFLFSGMTISLIICTFWPNGHDLRPLVMERDNLFTHMVQALYQTDTPTNVFPSIHVFNSIGVHLAVIHSDLLRDKKWIRIISAVLMVSICLSTVFLKQHSAVDGIGAILLAAALYKFVYSADRVFSKSKKLEQQLN